MVSYLLASGWRKSILPKRIPAAVERYVSGVYQPLPDSERACH
jgi:hypothetical protein